MAHIDIVVYEKKLALEELSLYSAVSHSIGVQTVGLPRLIQPANDVIIHS